MKETIYYHFLNPSKDYPRRRPSVWDYRTEDPNDSRRNPIEEPYQYYGNLLRHDDPSVKGESLMEALFEGVIPAALSKWNLKNSFVFEPLSGSSYFGPRIIRVGVTKYLKQRTSSYAFSFARFYGGDLWIHSDYLYYHGFDMTPIKDQVRLFLTNLEYHPLEILTEQKKTPYERYKGYLKAGVVKNFESAVKYYHLDEVKQYKIRGEGEKGTYVIRSYTKA